jgi:hypothetical protein
MDVIFGADRLLFVSDDEAGIVYRIKLSRAAPAHIKRPLEKLCLSSNVIASERSNLRFLKSYEMLRPRIKSWVLATTTRAESP